MVNQALRYRYLLSHEPFNFKGRLEDAPRTLAYAGRMVALQRELRAQLWDAECRDTVGALVTEPFAIQRRPLSDRHAKAAELLSRVGLPADMARRYPHQLSGGMQQRVAIARAYALDPQVLLMDEPFGALDAQTRVVMQEELVKLARKNPRTVLFITHSVEEAVYLADRVVIMTSRPGKIKEIIDVKTVREQENWDKHTKIEDVMDLESFVHLRTRIWKSLREEHAGTDH